MVECYTYKSHLKIKHISKFKLFHSSFIFLASSIIVKEKVQSSPKSVANIRHISLSHPYKINNQIFKIQFKLFRKSSLPKKFKNGFKFYNNYFPNHITLTGFCAVRRVGRGRRQHRMGNSFRKESTNVQRLGFQSQV